MKYDIITINIILFHMKIKMFIVVELHLIFYFMFIKVKK